MEFVLPTLIIGSLCGLFIYRHKIFSGIFLAKLLLKGLKSNGQEASFTEGKGNFGIISYVRRGRKYNIFIPYNRKLVSRMSEYTVFLLLPDGEEKINITQQPGIPYLMTANEMGGTGFQIINESGDEIIFNSDKHIVFKDL